MVLTALGCFGTGMEEAFTKSQTWVKNRFWIHPKYGQVRTSCTGLQPVLGILEKHYHSVAHVWDFVEASIPHQSILHQTCQYHSMVFKSMKNKPKNSSKSWQLFIWTTPKSRLNNIPSWHWGLDVLIHKMSFQSVPLKEKDPGVQCFLSPRARHQKDLIFMSLGAHVHVRGAYQKHSMPGPGSSWRPRSKGFFGALRQWMVLIALDPYPLNLSFQGRTFNM